MSGRARWLCAPVLAAALLAPPPAAVASPLDIPAAVPKKFRALVRARLHAPKPRRSWESRFVLQTGQGYDLTVVGVDDIVGILVTRHRNARRAHGRRPRRGNAVTAYVTRGTVTSKRIKASFGRFGRVSVRFRPARRKGKQAVRRCRGVRRLRNRSGVFVGRVRFTGEHRYVVVRAHRAKGRIRERGRRRCASRSRPPTRMHARPVRNVPGLFSQVSILQAGWREALTSTEFLALRARERTLFLAITEESMGSMARVRYAFAVSSSRAFRQNDALTAATLKPPFPFSHAGHYVATADGTRAWGGLLSAAFPGARRLPLAGPQFHVELESSF